jgi:hypothetical protein
MPNTDLEIKNIQFKRGKKAVLETKLVPELLGVPKDGEPIYETDTRKLKIGNGVTAYVDLPYFGGNNSNNADLDLPTFIIQDPLTNQILFYDAGQQAWINKDVADSIKSIKGYDTADQGSMLVKDQAEGLAWAKPVTDKELQQAVAAATAAKDEAGQYSKTAGDAAIDAEDYAEIARSLNIQTQTYVTEKFWWGSIEAYNALESITPGTFYFIKNS